MYGDYLSQQHTRNHICADVPGLYAQLSQQTQNDLQRETSLFYVPTRKPTDVMDYWGLAGGTWAVRPCGSEPEMSRVWKQAQTERQTYLCPKPEKTKKKEFGSAKG